MATSHGQLVRECRFLREQRAQMRQQSAHLLAATREAIHESRVLLEVTRHQVEAANRTLGVRELIVDEKPTLSRVRPRPVVVKEAVVAKRGKRR